MGNTIKHRRNAATREEKAEVKRLRDEAIRHFGNPIVERVTMTPGMAALLFLDFNDYNRAWDAQWSHGFGQIMTAGGWRLTSQGMGIYGEDGNLGDGQHRLAAIAATGVTLDVMMTLGVSKADVATIDSGKKRTPPDAAELRGVVNAKQKWVVLSGVLGYEHKVGIPRSINDKDVESCAREIERLSDVLDRVLELGEISRGDAVQELLDFKMAAKAIFLMIRHGWPEERALARIQEVQEEDYPNDDAPLLAARELIIEHKPDKDDIGQQKAVAVVLKGALMEEAGVTMAGSPATKKLRLAELRAATKKPPNPTYPVIPEEDEAAE
jgi:hypothetical protein